MKKVYIILILLMAALCPASVLLAQTQQTDQEKTQTTQSKDSEYYEVDVTAQLLPVFAVDKKGNPVYDLKKEDIEFVVDGKPAEILSFTSAQMKVREIDQAAAPGAGKKEAQAPLPPVERINFIIMDTLISNQKLMELNKVIARTIISKASPGDSYVIFQTNQAQGFKYVIGPEKDKKKLLEALENVRVPYIRRSLMSNVARLKREYYQALGTHGERDSIDTSLIIMKAEREQEMYERDIIRFTEAVRELKYALKTIRLPKTVFLISYGMKGYALGLSGGTYYRLLEDAAKAVNYGGGMLYVVNPVMFKSKNKRMVMKFMADAAGGKLIHGGNIREIADNVKKSTSAFYELAFYPPGQSGARNRISITCKRKDVEIISVNYSENSVPYAKMNNTEKKLFALNVINGGSWSRITAKVGKIRYKKVTSGTNPSIEISLPQNMINRPLDVFQVQIDPETQKADMVVEKKTITGKATLQITPTENRNTYFVLIEPLTPFCVYNQVNL